MDLIDSFKVVENFWRMSLLKKLKIRFHKIRFAFKNSIEIKTLRK